MNYLFVLINVTYSVLQLRECLEPEVYELFHKKLTEQALIKDPKFLWCCHVSYLQVTVRPVLTEYHI